jgi:hypothetical protein
MVLCFLKKLLGLPEMPLAKICSLLLSHFSGTITIMFNTVTVFLRLDIHKYFSWSQMTTYSDPLLWSFPLSSHSYFFSCLYNRIQHYYFSSIVVIYHISVIGTCFFCAFVRKQMNGE